MNNEGIKKWSFCLMNPPYGMATNTIHLKFVDKCLDIANKQITIMPFKFITKHHNCYEKYKKQDKWNEQLVSVEEVNSSLFKGTAMESVAIYLFENDRKENFINVDFLETGIKQLNKISDYKKSSDYEDEILKYLYNEHITDKVIWAGGYGSDNKKKFIKQGYSEKDALELESKTIKTTCKRIERLKEKVYLILSHITGTTFFSKSSGIIITSLDEMESHALKCRFSDGFEVMGFDSIKEAENCMTAMNNYVLRFGLYIAHPGRHIIERKSYKYIPNIDWSDDRVNTDEGLLEVCGCPKDKCKEYADYCKKIIDEVDAKK